MAGGDTLTCTDASTKGATNYQWYVGAAPDAMTLYSSSYNMAIANVVSAQPYYIQLWVKKNGLLTKSSIQLYQPT